MEGAEDNTSNTRSHTKNNNIIRNITTWKQIIMDEIIQDDVLSKLLHYNSPNALRQEDLNSEEKRKLYQSKVFGYRYNPQVVEESTQFITVGISRFAPVEGFRTISNRYIAGYIYFYILVNNQNMKMESGYRQDLIADRLHNLFHENEDIGIGTLKFDNLIENWEHNNTLGGYILGYKVTDFA